MMYKNKVKLAGLLALAGASLLTGCNNSSKNKELVAATSEKVLAEPQVRVPAEPEWYSNLPADNDVIYATANAVSPDWQMAEKIAMREARVALAQHLEIMVNAMQRGFDEQLTLEGERELLQSNQEVAETVTHTILSGSYVDKKETHLTPENNYRVFVRMALDKDIVRKKYLDELKRYKELETRLRANDAFKELEKRVEDYNKEMQQKAEQMTPGIEKTDDTGS